MDEKVLISRKILDSIHFKMRRGRGFLNVINLGRPQEAHPTKHNEFVGAIPRGCPDVKNNFYSVDDIESSCLFL